MDLQSFAFLSLLCRNLISISLRRTPYIVRSTLQPLELGTFPYGVLRRQIPKVAKSNAEFTSNEESRNPWDGDPSLFHLVRVTRTNYSAQSTEHNSASSWLVLRNERKITIRQERQSGLLEQSLA